jgi:large subunit ribosomal protein L7/L12
MSSLLIACICFCISILGEDNMAKEKLTQKQLIEAVEQMTVLELAEFVKALEEKFGVTAAAPAVQASAPGAQAAAEAAPAEEKTEFSVFITAIGEKKIQVIKEVRAITNLGLKEAKELVEGMEKPVVENADKKTADEVKAKLESAGATIELK